MESSMWHKHTAEMNPSTLSCLLVDKPILSPPDPGPSFQMANGKEQIANVKQFEFCRLPFAI
jgi:hypothetical protein